MKNRIDSSRQRTPWDNKEDITIIETFIQDKYKDNLQDFLCSPMNSKPRNKLEKVNILLELALNIKVQRFI